MRSTTGPGMGRDIRPLPMSIARTVRACPGEGRGRASGDPSEGVPRCSPGRWLRRIWPPGHRQDRRCAATCLLLGPCATQVLRHPCRDAVAIGRGSPAAHCRTLCHRGRYPRHACREPSLGASAAQPVALGRGDAHMADRAAWTHLRPFHTGSGDARYALNHWNRLILYLR